jgi:hypothetical protein
MQNELAGIGFESIGSPKLQNLNCDVVVGVVVIHHHREVAAEERKIIQMISAHNIVRIDVVNRVDLPQ